MASHVSIKIINKLFTKTQTTKITPKMFLSICKVYNFENSYENFMFISFNVQLNKQVFKDV